MLGGCVTKKDLEEPVAKYLSECYGLKDGDFRILSTDDNWFEGIDPRESNIRFTVDSKGEFRDIDVLKKEGF